MNILLIAYACEPNKGSEPEVGWKNAVNIARIKSNANVFVITRSNNQANIESVAYPKNLNFLYFDLPRGLSFWKKKGRGVRTYYYLWMMFASKKLKKLGIKFDIIHHITFVNDWLPSLFIKNLEKNSVFIWGPIGSNEPIPPTFLLRRDIYRDKVKHLIQNYFRKHNKKFKKTILSADYIIGINQQTLNKLSHHEIKNFIQMPAIGITAGKDALEFERKHNTETFKVLYVGSRLPIKNFQFAKEVFRKFQEKYKGLAELYVAGPGLNYHSDNDQQIRYMGFLDKLSLNNLYKDCDVFLYPTFENAGFVILEAMIYKLPILAFDFGGPKEFITSYKDKQLVDLHNKTKQNSLDEMSEKLLFFATNREHAKNIGERNFELVVQENSWENKAKIFSEIYCIHE